MPSIVSITTKSVEEVQNYYGMFGQYGAYSPSQEQEVQGSGSGIIIGKNDSELSDRNQLSCSRRCGDLISWLLRQAQHVRLR